MKNNMNNFLFDNANTIAKYGMGWGNTHHKSDLPKDKNTLKRRKRNKEARKMRRKQKAKS